MPLAKSHSSSNPLDRKQKKNVNGGGCKKYFQSDETISKVYCDIVNGVSKSDILDKLTNGLYGNRVIGWRQALNYYNRAIERLQVDRVEEGKS